MRVASMVMSVAMSGLLLSQAACGDRASSDTTPTTFASYDAGAVPGGPGAKRQYAIGSAASDSLVTRMNHDIGMDGAELPAGSGSVAEGAALYAAQCANCHGRNGEGMAAASASMASHRSRVASVV